ncbi:hypothetical protein A9Q81_27050 [Gammaproteobacteria bacterium 42_54_T18]|nr:hypothetical protein A9Q81_27050 [Gammaproteobacteria bacterium 42_54_T18]
MIQFKKLSIKYKLIVVVLLTATIGLTLASGALLTYDRIKRKATISEEMQILSQVVALRSAVALSFGDKKNARGNLNTLKVRKNIRLACMYDDTGSVFVKVSQGKHDLECPSSGRRGGQFFVDDYLDVYQTIERNGEIIGHVFFRAGLEELNERLIQQLVVSVVVLFGSLCLAFGLTSRLQRHIYRPIIQLGNVAKNITKNNNYSIRAKTNNQDELGDTVNAFNNMLKQIESDKEKLTQLAYYDMLTRLPNRRMFTERIDFALENAAREKGGRVALIFLDLDKFKQVNDELGHDIGDLLLKEVGKRLNAAIPETATAFRLGGDEFTVIQINITSEQDVVDTAESIFKEFAPPLLGAGRELSISASLGIVISTGNDTSTSIMKNADIALYLAKDAGRGNFKIFAWES